jgi:hypothetical protein
MKARYVLLSIALVTALLLGACKQAEPTPEPVGLPEGEVGGPGGVLQGTSRLALATFRLEDTEYAVTPDQAAKLLPLWKAIQSGSLQGTAETEAVLKQIEGVLDEDQLAAIEGMELTFQEIGTWMQSPAAQALGIEMPARPEGGEAGSAGRPGGGAFQNMTEEQRNQFRQEFQNMSPEQRATRMAEMGIQRTEGSAPGDGPGGFGGGGQGGRPGGFAGRGGGNFLVDPLIELLTGRAAE